MSWRSGLRTGVGCDGDMMKIYQEQYGFGDKVCIKRKEMDNGSTKKRSWRLKFWDAKAAKVGSLW
jgi:hypothetical protein